MIPSLDFTLIKDSVILIICATTCLYCMVLSRRLKGLNSSKSGIRASINSLTDSIQQSHQAALQMQNAAQDNIATLNRLLEDAERATIKLDALSNECAQRHKSLLALSQTVEHQISTELPDAVESTRKTAHALTELLKKIRERQTAIIGKPSPGNKKPNKPALKSAKSKTSKKAASALSKAA